MDKDDDACLDDQFMEANQDTLANFELARQNTLKILDKVVEHETAVRELQEAHAAGNLSIDSLRLEVQKRDKILKRLRQSQAMFSKRADELQKILGLTETE